MLKAAQMVLYRWIKNKNDRHKSYVKISFGTFKYVIFHLLKKIEQSFIFGLSNLF